MKQNISNAKFVPRMNKRLALQEKKIDDSSHLDVVKIAHLA
jgi:hypothetical protein